MADIEKVIKGLEFCGGSSCRTGIGCNEKCPYFNGWLSVPCSLREDALELLKEQKAVVRCKDCIKVDVCCRRVTDNPDWFCADGIAKDTDVLNK